MGMSVQSTVFAGRRAAEARMTSRATIRRRTDRLAQDDETGLESPEWLDVYTSVPFRLGGSGTPGSSGTSRQDIGGVEVQTATRYGHLPASLSDLIDGDLIDILTGENAGRVFRIVEVEWKDQATARRVPLLAEDRPEEWS